MTFSAADRAPGSEPIGERAAKELNPKSDRRRGGSQLRESLELRFERSGMVSSLIVGGTGVSGSFIVSGLIERGHDVTVYTTGRTVPTEEESPWWYDGSITRLEGGVDSAEDVDATLTEACGGPRRAEMSRAA